MAHHGHLTMLYVHVDYDGDGAEAVPATAYGHAAVAEPILDLYWREHLLCVAFPRAYAVLDAASAQELWRVDALPPPRLGPPHPSTPPPLRPSTSPLLHLPSLHTPSPTAAAQVTSQVVSAEGRRQ